MDNNNYENAEIKLPVEVMKHLRLAVREMLKAELAYCEIFYDDEYEVNGDVFLSDMVGLLMPKMVELLPATFEEICEEEGL